MLKNQTTVDRASVLFGGCSLAIGLCMFSMTQKNLLGEDVQFQELTSWGGGQLFHVVIMERAVLGQFSMLTLKMEAILVLTLHRHSSFVHQANCYAVALL